MKISFPLSDNHAALLRKVTVNLSLNLLTLYAIKAYGGVELQLHPFRSSALDGSKYTASCPARLPLGEAAKLIVKQVALWVVERLGRFNDKTPGMNTKSLAFLPAGCQYTD